MSIILPTSSSLHWNCGGQVTAILCLDYSCSLQSILHFIAILEFPNDISSYGFSWLSTVQWFHIDLCIKSKLLWKSYKASCDLSHLPSSPVSYSLLHNLRSCPLNPLWLLCRILSICSFVSHSFSCFTLPYSLDLTLDIPSLGSERLNWLSLILSHMFFLSVFPSLWILIFSWFIHF